MVDVIKFEPKRAPKVEEVPPAVQVLDIASNLDFSDVIVVGWLGKEGEVQEFRVLTNVTRYSEIAWILDSAKHALLANAVD